MIHLRIYISPNAAYTSLYSTISGDGKRDELRNGPDTSRIPHTEPDSYPYRRFAGRFWKHKPRTKYTWKRQETYVVLIQPRVALDSTAGKQIITRINPVALSVSSRRVPLSRDLEKLLNRI